MQTINIFNYFCAMSKDLFTTIPLGGTFSLLTKTYFGALTKQLEALEVERHFSILLLIETSKKGCCQQNICDQLKIDKVSMVRMLDYLIEKKYIKKVVNPADRREYFLELTPLAVKNMPVIHAAIDELNAHAFEGIPKNKRKDFYKTLEQLDKNLNKLPANKILVNYKKSRKESK
jgi:DNA-binding MarR family transcriptional regulator